MPVFPLKAIVKCLHHTYYTLNATKGGAPHEPRFSKSFAATWRTTLQVVDLAKTAKKHKPDSLQKSRD